MIWKLIESLIGESPRAKLAEKLERDLSNANQKIDRLQRNLKVMGEERTAEWSRLDSDKEQLKKELAKSLERLQSLALLCQELTGKAQKLEAKAGEDAVTIQDLQSRLDHLQSHFVGLVERQANEFLVDYKAKQLTKIYADYDAMMTEACSIIEDLQAWGEKVGHGHQSKSEIIKSLAQNYSQNIDGIGKAFTEERSSYLEQIELLQEKIGYLQQELAGDLVEPEYADFGFAPEGKVANAIAREIFTSLDIPLAVKGFYNRPDGGIELGYGYSRSTNPEALVQALKGQSKQIATRLRIHQITGVKKLEIADVLVINCRLTPTIKESEVKLLAGSPEEFIKYVVSHPLRYRLIADPGSGKTPITAVMISEILKVGGTLGNTAKGKKIPHTLITVSCPDVTSSQKDKDYPLEPFLKYGDTTAAVKSFNEALADWEYRKRDTNYAANFFQLWVWDELDNTLNNADDPVATGKKFKEILKQAHHTGVGWVVSGQSVMTKQIPGFFDDDRDLFTEIIIGSTKIRKYLEKYGKKALSESIVKKLLANLEQLDGYLEEKNPLVTDDARLLRLALVLDSRSPKLYFLPNFDSAQFDLEAVENTRTRAEQAKRSFLVRSGQSAGQKMVADSQNLYIEGVSQMAADPPFPTIGGADQSDQNPRCPHCGNSELKTMSDNRYQCQGCKKRFVQAKAVWS